jgi:hypothetical protein
VLREVVRDANGANFAGGLDLLHDSPCGLQFLLVDGACDGAIRVIVGEEGRVD